MTRKILIISYYWPPSGGAGVQRWLKLASYLLESGWEPIVLTVEPDHAEYPALDRSLELEINPAIKIIKTAATNYFKLFHSGGNSSKISGGFATGNDRSLKSTFARFLRGNFFLPDPRRGWNRHAFIKASELINKEEIKYVITTSPPHSTQLIGLKLKRHFPHIIWTSDFRDPWTDIYYYKKFYGTFIARYIDRQYEKSVLSNSDLITTVGKGLAEIISKKIKTADSKTHIISNGYDEKDFRDKELIDGNKKFIISYVGTISDQYPAEGFFQAIDKLSKSGSLSKFSIRFIGQTSEKVSLLTEKYALTENVEFIPYCTHNEAIVHMMSSDCLVMIIPDHQENKLIITGKIYEYLRSRKPILCIGPPDGDAAEIISQSGHGIAVTYTDASAIESFLLNASSFATDSDISKFSHSAIVQNLVSILEYH